MSKPSTKKHYSSEQELAQARDKIVALERQAEIEAALERVRAQTMAMHQSDELREVVVVLFEQLKQIGLDMRECEIIIFDKQTLGMELWGSGFTETKLHESYRIPFLDHPYYRSRIEAWQQGVPYRTVELAGKEKQSFYRLYFEETDFKQLPAATKKAIRAVDRFIISEAFTKHGLLETIGDAPLPDEQAAVLQRFAKVFEQTYTRFLDLLQAEAQAREAQIEAALERVRARTMGMHHSDELLETVKLMYQQLDLLGLTAAATDVEVCIIEEKTGLATVWTTDLSFSGSANSLTLPFSDAPVLDQEFQAWQNASEATRKELFFVREWTGEEWDQFLSHVEALPGWGPVVEELRSGGIKQWFTHNAYFSHGMLTLQGIDRLDDDSQTLLKRFARVFEQTYTRFLDLQKAEAQAREAQIEAALERVRTRTMAMYRSGEIAVIVGKIFEELTLLDIVLNRVLIWIFYHEEKYSDWWSANSELESNAESYRVDYSQQPVFLTYLEAWEKRIPLLLHTLSGKTKDSWEDYLFNDTGLSKLPKEVQKGMRAEGTIFTTSVISDYGLLMSGSLEPLSDANIDIIQRFGRVFQQAYTRYLDVQKAEAQAREAQIEAALERVRARTMAMHKSEELLETAAVLYRELLGLGIQPFSCGFTHIDAKTATGETWLTRADGTIIPHAAVFPYTTDQPPFPEIYAAWKQNEDFLRLELEGDVLEASNRYVIEHTGIPLSEIQRSFSGSLPDRMMFNCAFYSNGYILVMTPEPISSEDETIVTRFAKVFDLTYRRFLDLKQAEAQAREAQIEAALERVRARAMAMHTSEELKEVAYELRKQMGLLGQTELEVCAIHLYEESDDFFESWFAIRPPDSQGEIIQGQARFPKSGVKIVDEMMQLYLSDQNDYVLVNEGEKAIEWFNAMKVHSPEAYNAIAGVVEEVPADKIHAFWSCADFSGGSLGMVTWAPPEEDARHLLRRSANVFDLAYRRFLDLKQAEEQAREAQIEASLERVRAAGMAMHHSSDLQKAILVVFDQLRELGIEMDFSGIHVFENGKRDFNLWIATPGRDYSEQVHIPHRKLSTFDNFFDARERGDTFLVESFSKRQKDAFFGPSLADIIASKRIKLIREAPGWMRVSALTRHTALIVASYDRRPFTATDCETFKRFAKVFEQTYTRFLDLQKAEAQAREAQIEAAMERIRSRAIAMRSSNELKDVIIELRRQIDSLGQLDLEASVIHLYPEGAEMFESFAAVRPPGESGEIVVANVFFPVDATEHIKRMIEMYHSDQSEYTIQFDKTAAEEWQGVMIDHAPMIAERREGFVENRKATDNPEFWNFADFSHGSLLLVTHSPASNDTYEMLRKAAQVFDQAYTRFLDLQKAEAQAREAQIEAALERVRARAMGMHSSDALREVVAVVFKELQQLGFDVQMCLIFIVDKTTGDGQWWSTTMDGESLPSSYTIPAFTEHDHPLVRYYMEALQQGIPYGVFELAGKSKEEYDRFLFEETDLKHIPQAAKEGMMAIEGLFLCDGFMGRGSLQIVGPQPLPDDKAAIVQRFAKVIDLTYTRVDDLQKAEARAREAEQQASLDRVRAEIASMRTADDLNSITPLIWRELTTLGVPFFRCGVFIIDETDEEARVYLSTPKGKSLAVMKLKFDSTPLVEHTVAHWREKRVYREEWNREQFIEWTQTILSQGMIKSPQQYQGGKEAPEKLVLQLVPFTQGMLYVGSKAPLSDGEIDLMKVLADAFAVAYARYEDFQRLEAAKAEVEAALQKSALLSKELEAKNIALETENERKARELEEARRLQLAMLPKTVPSLPDLQIAVYMKTATEVGGDYYDFHVAKDGTLTVVVGDATGHGLKAGTMVTVAKSLFSSLAQEPDIVSTFTAMSTSIKAMKLPLLSMCLAMLKIKNGKMTLSSAGIPPPLIYRESSKTVEEVIISGMPLGAMAGFPYRQKEIPLQPSDTILLMSDGFPERMNDKEQMFDYPRAQEAFADVATQAPRKIVKQLVKASDGWANGRPQDDDVTFVVIKVGGASCAE